MKLYYLVLVDLKCVAAYEQISMMQNLMKMTSNTISIVVFSKGLKCLHNIHFNTQWGALCVEMDIMQTFPRNQDVTVKLKFDLIYIKF